VVRSTELGYQPSDSIKHGECLDQLSDCQLLGKNSTPRSLLGIAAFR
jgi:hypothetical protein